MTRTITSVSMWILICAAVWMVPNTARAQDAAQAQSPPVPQPQIFLVNVDEEVESAETVDLFSSDDDGLTGAVDIDAFGQVDIHVKDQNIGQVLQVLSIQSRRNIIASRNVTGSISADLYSVDFYEAIEAILHANGFGYEEKGNFVYVYTAEELTQRNEEQRKAVTRVYRLRYLRASDASTFIQPLLSGSGSVAVSGDVPQGMIPSTSDHGTNSFALPDTLILHDYPENVDEIIALLGEVDVRPPQIQIDATILEARLNEANAFGVDLSVAIDFRQDIFLDPLNSVDSLISGNVVGEDGADSSTIIGAFGRGGGAQTTVGNTSTGRSGFKIGYLSNHVNAFIRALDEVTDTSVIAKPRMLVLNKQKADLLIGAKLGFVSTTATETSTTQTVEFLDIGTQLTVVPIVSDDNFIRLDIRPSVSDGSTSQIGEFVIPNETTNEIQTNILVRSGTTAVIGGLFKEDTDVSRSQVPGIGDIPGIGAAFKGHDDSITRSEVIFLITPTIVKDEAVYASGESALSNIELARIGYREGLLPWSRSKLTRWHMREALKNIEAGKPKQALWWVNVALSVDPTYVEALKLRRDLSGETPNWPHRSILKNSINKLIDTQLSAKEKAAVQIAEAAQAASGQMQTDGASPENGFGAAPNDRLADILVPDDTADAQTMPEPAFEVEEADDDASPQTTPVINGIDSPVFEPAFDDTTLSAPAAESFGDQMDQFESVDHATASDDDMFDGIELIVPAGAESFPPVSEPAAEEVDAESGD